MILKKKKNKEEKEDRKEQMKNQLNKLFLKKESIVLLEFGKLDINELNKKDNKNKEKEIIISSWKKKQEKLFEILNLINEIPRRIFQ